MEFFNLFLEKDATEFELSQIKQFGLEIDYFSRVYGRMLMVGHVVYKTNKNYRSKQQFETFRANNTISIPTIIMLFEESDHVIANMESIDNLFINKFEEIKKKYLVNNAIKMFGYVKMPKRKKNGKQGRSYKVNRNKRFVIPIDSLIYVDDDNNTKYCTLTSIHCTFRQKLV